MFSDCYGKKMNLYSFRAQRVITYESYNYHYVSTKKEQMQFSFHNS